MPIDYGRYPRNWKTEIRPRILKRSNNCCEFCGVPNYAQVWRDDLGFWFHDWEILEIIESTADEHSLNLICPGWDRPWRTVRIILTIAHLDHDESNHDVTDDRLAALCQRCHLMYDAPEKARRRKEKQ